mmetsp:Transcript_6936/g.12830  ORF Transcript_6936/g.12830 Transcript_6936/m.12830 type:complete len:223 (+) Transcript_6936:654-1322(+)
MRCWEGACCCCCCCCCCWSASEAPAAAARPTPPPTPATATASTVVAVCGELLLLLAPFSFSLSPCEVDLLPPPEPWTPLPLAHTSTCSSSLRTRTSASTSSTACCWVARMQPVGGSKWDSSSPPSSSFLGCTLLSSCPLPSALVVKVARTEDKCEDKGDEEENAKGNKGAGDTMSLVGVVSFVQAFPPSASAHSSLGNCWRGSLNGGIMMAGSWICSLVVGC